MGDPAGRNGVLAALRLLGEERRHRRALHLRLAGEGESRPGTEPMDTFLNHFAVFLEWIFFLGLIGSAMVILLTTIEDVKVLLEKDEPRQSSEGVHRQG
jgi:hypothetical protein